MFTSLFQLEKKAVTVFSSTDKNAPTLTNSAGSLKTLLKACLVTGYGDKQGLGWQMLYETNDKNSACFASNDPTASKFVLKVDNTNANAKLSAYQSMTSFTQGEKPFVIDNIYETQVSEWRLIGHSKAFILLLDVVLRDERIAYPLLFGDLPRQNKRIFPVCVMWSGRKNSHNSSGVQSTLFYHKNGNSGSNYFEVIYAAAYPFVASSGQTGENLTNNYCRFSYLSYASSTALHEPILVELKDGVWSFLPMLQPLSAPLSDVANLGLINENMMKARTGRATQGSGISNLINNDVVIPLDWWYA